MTEHAQRAHAKLSASGADRWLACPGSVKLEEGLPDTTSEFAQWGTTCHELAELALRERFLGEAVTYQKTRKVIDLTTGGLTEVPAFEAEMFEVVAEYRAHIERLITEYGNGEQPVVFVEQRVDFSEWVPEGFGTSDVILLFVEQGLVIADDLKTGKGVRVFAEKPQGKLYSAGVMTLVSGICDIKRVITAISQPRLNHYDVWDCTAEELLHWLDTEVRPTAREAFDGSDRLASGDHCQFCKAKPICPQLRADAMAVFDDGPVANTLTPAQIAELLPKLDLVQAWAKSVQAYALDQALNHNTQFPGYKLVTGRSVRKWSDEGEVAAVLRGEGYKHSDIYETTTSFLGIGAAEKLVGKKHRVFELTVKTEGKPTLVPEADKRPEFNSQAAVMAAFDD